MGIVDFGRYKLVEVSQLVKADWNYKEENEATAKKLAANIRRNGLVENLIVRELEDGRFEVLNGNHRLDALIELGEEKAIVCDKGRLSLQEAQRLAIETNESKFHADHIVLANILSDLADAYSAEDLLETLPYTEAEFQRYLNMQDFNWDDLPEPPEVVGADGTTSAGGVVLKVKMTEDLAQKWQHWKETVTRVTHEDTSDLKALIYAVEQLIATEEKDFIFTDVEERQDDDSVCEED